jgi:iron-sulfur cluster assembly protein
MRAMPKAITLTPAAAERVKAILAARKDKPAVGLKVGVSTQGCSGKSYTLDYAEAIGPHDEVIEDQGVTILLDPKATLFLIGTEIDYVTDKLSSSFVFKNPNEKGRCGCGESFTV